MNLGMISVLNMIKCKATDHKHKSGVLTVWVLIGSVDIVCTHNDRLKLIAMPKCSHEHLSSCFAAAVGIHWRQGLVFAMAARTGVSCAVRLIRRHLYELFDTARFGAL